MARYLRIRCIVKTQQTDAHERIEAICGLTPDGSHWTLTHEDAVSQIENRSCAFYIERPSLLNSRQLKFCLSAVGIFGFLTFEPSCEALNDRSEDEVRHTD